MELRLFQKTFHLSIGKIVLFVVVGGLLMGMGWFAVSVHRYYRAIQSGAANPLLEQRLQSSFSQMVANASVTPDDLVRLQSNDAPTLGKKGAKLTIVEFLDFGCPFCRASHAPVRELMEKYKNQVFFIARDFPIEELHPGATLTALAAQCAHEQARYWPYHDKLYANQDFQTEADLGRYAQEVGLDSQAFQACLKSQKHLPRVEQDMSDGLAAGVQGTPTFFFNGVKIQGALDRDTFELLILQFLKS